MRLMRFTALVVGALLSVTHAVAAPMSTPFLSVDVNGYNAGGGQTLGPTLAGFQPLEAAEGLFLDPSIDWGNSGATGLTKVFATSQGNVTANLIGVNPNASKGARNRGANAGGQSDLYQDFVFAQRNTAIAFGQNYVRLQLTGLTPNQPYEVTMFAREPVFNPDGSDNPLTSYQAWTDIAALGGVDGPGPWLNANVGAGASYQPVFVDHDMDANTAVVNTGYKNPIPTRARSQVSGPDALSASDPYFHSASFTSKADATGKLVVYGWSDPNGFGSNVQGASLLNGFQLGKIPEPASLALVGISFVGLLGLRRRVR